MSPEPAATANNAGALLRAESLRKRFGARLVLADATLALEAGEVALLTGANGSGKTTLARILATLLPPDSGQVLLDGEHVGRRPAAARRCSTLFMRSGSMISGVSSMSPSVLVPSAMGRRRWASGTWARTVTSGLSTFSRRQKALWRWSSSSTL